MWVWWNGYEAMTEEEQDRVEKQLASAALPCGNDDLQQEDDIVPAGGNRLPRKAAA